MGTGKSETLTGTIDVGFPEYEAPPEDPVPVLRNWLERAIRCGVREPKALALATANRYGRPSTRIVAVNYISRAGIVFSTHAGSQKGRELAENPWASGVLYWRETSQQIILTGPVERLPASEADRLWMARPKYTHAMSVASRQSEELTDVAALRAKADRLSRVSGPLPRPESYCAFELRPESLEFWANGKDRLHERLRYSRAGDGWVAKRLQP